MLIAMGFALAVLVCWLAGTERFADEARREWLRARRAAPEGRGVKPTTPKPTPNTWHVRNVKLEEK